LPDRTAWDGGGATNNWSEAANWSGDTVPGSGDVAIFDGTNTEDATIDAGFAGSVSGLQINAGYTGTITQAAALTVGSSGYSQSTATFTGGSSTLTVQGNFSLTGGTFNAPSGTLSFPSNFTVGAGATFNTTTAHWHLSAMVQTCRYRQHRVMAKSDVDNELNGYIILS